MNESDITSIVQSLTREQQFADRNEWIERSRNLLHGRRDPTIPGLENLQLSYHSPKPKKDSHAYVNKLVAAPMTISVAAQVGAGGQETDAAQRRAQRLENLFYRLWHHWVDSGVVARALFDTVALKRGHLRLRLNGELIDALVGDQQGENVDLARFRAKLAEYERGERIDLIVCEHVPPETVYWTPGRDVKMIAARVPLHPLREQYARLGVGINVDAQGTPTDVVALDGATGLDAGHTDWNKKATLHIVESADKTCHYLQGQGSKGFLLGVYDNPFGRPAIYDFEGEPTGQDHALDGCSALIEGLYETEPLRNALGKLIMSAAVEAAQNQKVIEAVEGDWAQQARRDAGGNPAIWLEKDGIMRVAPGWRMSPWRAELSSDVLTAFNLVSLEADQMGFPKVLGAPEELDAKSGYDRAKATDAVSSQLDPPLMRIAGTAVEMFKSVKSAAVELGITVPVRNVHPTARLGATPRHVQEEIAVSPEDAQVDVDISVRFESKTQYSKIAEIETYGPMVGRWMSETQYLTDVLGVDDPERVRREIQQDKMRQLADERSFQDAVALFQRVAPYVEGEALEEADVSGLVSLARAQYQGGGEAARAVRQPVNEPAPNPEAELGMTGMAV